MHRPSLLGHLVPLIRQPEPAATQALRYVLAREPPAPRAGLSPLSGNSCNWRGVTETSGSRRPAPAPSRSAPAVSRRGGRARLRGALRAARRRRVDRPRATQASVPPPHHEAALPGVARSRRLHACALVHSACRNGHSALYVARLPAAEHAHHCARRRALPEAARIARQDRGAGNGRPRAGPRNSTALAPCESADVPETP